MKKTMWSAGVCASLALGAASTLLWACGDDDALSRPPFEEEVDASREASLPPPGGEHDGGDLPDAREPYDGSPAAVECAASPCVVALAAGDTHYCALIADGTVRCWGESSMLGTADITAVGVPATPDGVAGASSIAAMKDGTCVVLADGGVDCWGARWSVPERVREVTSAKVIAPGVDVSCTVDPSDALFCWGDSPALGSGQRTMEIGGDKATRASISSAAAFVVTSNGVLRSWGADIYTLGRGTSTVDWNPARVQGLPEVDDVASSDLHVCAHGRNGDVFCWGDGTLLGTGYVRRELAPVLVSFPSAAYPQQLAAHESHSCARMTDGTVYCWGGNNALGELGQVRPLGVYVPAKVEPLKDVVSVAVGYRSSCALAKDGSVRCWGNNDHGQLGRGGSDLKRNPLPAPVVFQ
ncbi:MAG: hypothetical protein K0S65_1979 [Labilithrix sp.]|nr:hypothetical protein [Labilithrix sp.]